MTTATTRRTDGTLRVPRSRGAVSGLLLLLLGAWCALIPFLGPVFHYGYGPSAWTMTSGRFWYELLPGLVAAVAGLLLMGSGDRVSGSAAGWLGAAAGAWVLIGPALGPVFHMGHLGAPIDTGTWHPALDVVGLTSGLGAAMVLFGALAAGRFSVRGVRDARLAAERREQRHEADRVSAEPSATSTYPDDAARAADRDGTSTATPGADARVGRGVEHDLGRDAGSRSITDR